MYCHNRGSSCTASSTFARMETRMQHYQAAGFSEAVSRLAAAPRRPSTNRMYDNTWFRFAHWAAGQGIDSLGPTAAQIATSLFCIPSLILTIYKLKLSRATGPTPQTIKGCRIYTSNNKMLQDLRAKQSGSGQNYFRYDFFCGIAKSWDYASPTTMKPGHCARGLE